MRLTVTALVLAALLLTVAPATLTAQNKLMNPALLNETAPEKFQAKFDTSKGEFIIEVTRAWAPKGADRFYNLVKNGFYTDCRFFRVIDNFMVQFGINGDPKVSQVWRPAQIQDDPVKQSNSRGYITYAMAGPNTRTTQLFINFKNNAGLDSQGFSPFGKVIKGMDIVDSLNKEYGGTPSDHQTQIQMQGNAYLNKEYPKLDFIKTATIVAADAK
jgi:peptidyl-prolyl cis-trans isomerase A (cyclophilin A)